jgi:hypothetical protein
MAFPGEFNISYYKGDTYEFEISPKKTDGTLFDLTDYSVKFLIASERGSNSAIEGWSQISEDNNTIKCAILPATLSSASSDSTYVYEVEVRKTLGENNYPIINTILTGSLSITEQVSNT